MRQRVASDELLVSALVVATALTVQRTPGRRWEIPTNLAAAITAVAIARAGGASWEGLGLEPAEIPRGLRWGAATVPVIGAIVACGVAAPATRTLFADERADRWDRRELAYQALVRVPLATAIAEELLFRSAMLDVELRLRSRRAAIITTALAFGLWHVAPALRAHEANPAGGALADRVGGRPATVTATVAATAAAGVGLAVLRTRSRSVVAPVIAHTAINVAGLLASRVASRSRRLGRSGGR